MQKFAQVVAILLCIVPASTYACATCYGAQDSALTEGINVAIMVMTGLTFCVLGCFAAFFLWLRHNAKQFAKSQSAKEV